MANKQKSATPKCSVNNTKLFFTDFRVLFKEAEETQRE